MFWIFLYIIGFILCFILFWRQKLEIENKITVSDLLVIIFFSIFCVISLLVYLFMESDNIIIYRRK